MNADKHHEIQQRWAQHAKGHELDDLEDPAKRAGRLLKMAEKVAEELSGETAFQVTKAQVLAVALADSI